MKLEHIIRKLYFEPLCITTTGHAALRSVVERKLASGYKIEDGDTDIFGEPIPGLEIYGNVAVIPVAGPITQHASLMERTCGVTGVSSIRGMISQAKQTAGVDTMLFNFNSPGGTVTGVPELANEIVELGKTYKTIGYTDSLAASAGFWLYSATNERYAAPTADLLSVGVYSYILDTSKIYEDAGAKIELFTSGDLKGIGIEGTKMSDAQKQHMQEEVDKIGVMFRSFVKERIPGIEDKHMRGQCLMASELKEVGVVDGYANTLEEIFGI
jgi:ClpP class serine protease